MIVIPGIYKDLAHPKQEMCTVLGGALNEEGEDERIIIQRTLLCGSITFLHLTFEEFRRKIHIGDQEIPRFSFIMANFYQD